MRQGDAQTLGMIAGRYICSCSFSFGSFDYDCHAGNYDLVSQIMMAAVMKMLTSAISKKKIQPSFMSWS